MNNVSNLDLITELITHENLSVREIAVESIKGKNSKKTGELLILAMKDENPEIRKKGHRCDFKYRKTSNRTTNKCSE